MSAEQNNAQLERLRNAIADAYAACNEKDATIPSDKIISGLADCIRSIQHGIPDGYIKIADTWNYTTRFAYGTFSKSSDTLVSKCSIPIGFKPKVFFMRNNNSIQATSSTQYLTSTVSVVNNDYSFVIVAPDGSISTRTAIASGLYLNSSKPTSVQSNGLQNVFSPTDNGVVGNGATNGTVYVKSGVTYFWFAWG